MTATTAETNPDEVDRWTKPPFLRRVRIRGYKSIAFCDVALQPLTVLVGRNGAGKSNFLDALAFLRDAMDTNVTGAVASRGGWPSINCRSAETRELAIELELDLPSVMAQYQVELASEDGTHVSTLRESLDVTSKSDGATAGFTFHGGLVGAHGLGRDPARGRSAPLTRGFVRASRRHHLLLSAVEMLPALFDSSVDEIRPLLELANGLRSMGVYNFHPDSIRTVQQPSAWSLLLKDGRNIASVIRQLKLTDSAVVERIKSYLALVTDEVRDFDTVGLGDFETIRFWLQDSSQSSPFELDASSMSDGTLRALASLVAAFQVGDADGPSVVGIEEPETALHPAALLALVDALDEATQRTQILLTTHSADLLAHRDLTPGQVLVVRNRGGQTHITPVSADSQEIVRKELYTLADLQRMDQLDLDADDLKRQAKSRNGAAGN